jgi:hypothetical protein
MFSEVVRLLEKLKVSTSILYAVSLNAGEIHPSRCKLHGEAPARAAIIRSAIKDILYAFLFPPDRGRIQYFQV